MALRLVKCFTYAGFPLLSKASHRFSFHNIYSKCQMLHTSSIYYDWIRRNTPRKPERHKINRIYSHLEEEQVQIFPDKIPDYTLTEIETELYNSVRYNVSESIKNNTSRLFAVIHMAGKQFKVTTEDLISIKAPLMEAQPGDLIRLEKVIIAGNTDFSIVGRPLIPRNNVTVMAMVVEKTLQHPSLWYQFHRRRRHRKMRG